MRKKIIDDPMDDIKLGKDMSRSRFRVVNSDITKLSERKFFNGFIQSLDLNRKKIWYPKQQECEGYLLISDYKYSKLKGHKVIAHARFKYKLTHDIGLNNGGSWLTLKRVPFDDDVDLTVKPRTSRATITKTILVKSGNMASVRGLTIPRPTINIKF